MPTATRYGTPQVNQAPLPQARRTAAETDASTGVGASLARGRAFQAAAGLGMQVAEMGIAHVQSLAKEERERADHTAIIAADNQFDEFENKALYDPEKGALSKKGHDALGVPEQVGAEWNAVASQIEAAMSTPEQKAAFDKLKARRGQQLNGILARHTYEQVQAFEKEQVAATKVNAINNAIANAQDPQRIAEELARAESAVALESRLAGSSKEVAAAALSEVRSATHVGVVERLIGLDQTKKAQEYYEETQDQIAGSKREGVEQKLQVASVRDEARREADKILAGGGTYAEMLQKAGQIEDTKVSDEVKSRIRIEQADRERQAKIAEDELLDRTYNTISRSGGRLDAIPTDDWVKLGTHQPAVRAEALRLAKGIPVETDFTTYYRLMLDAAKNPIEWAATTNLNNYRGKLGETELKQLTSIQAAAISADTKKVNSELSGFTSTKRVIDSALTVYGIDSNPKKGSVEEQKLGQFQRIVQQAVEAEESSIGRKLKDTEIERVVDSAFLQFSKPEQKGFFFTTPPSIAFDMTIAEVPITDRRQIEEVLQANRIPVTDLAILKHYKAMLAKRGGK